MNYLKSTLFITFLIVVSCGQSYGVTVKDTLNPIADAYVRSGDNANSNYGSDNLLYCKTSSNSNLTRHTYLQFDLSSSEGFVTGATLRLKVAAVDNPASDGSTVKYHSREADLKENFPQLIVMISDDTNPPAAPGNLNATVLSDTKIELDWSDNVETDLSHYNIKRSMTQGGPYTQISTNLHSSAYIDMDLSSQTSYYYVVTAVDSFMNESEVSNEADGITLEPPPPPDAPTNLAVGTVVSTAKIDLTWDDQSDETGYIIERKTGGDFSVIAQLDSNIVAYSDGNLYPSITYTYRISAFNTGGNSDYSNEVTATTGDAYTYYVDATSGNDSSNGLSPATAWQTLANVKSSIFYPGDTILLKAGSVWNERLSLHGSGTESNPIILDMYGTGNKPIINGGGGSGNLSEEPAVLLQNEEYWEINNLFITHTDGSSAYQGDLWAIRVNVTQGGEFNHIYIRNCIIEKVNGAVATKTTGGIYVTVNGDLPAWYNDLKIQNNRIGNINNLGDPDGVVGGNGIATKSDYGKLSRGANRKPYLNVLISGNIVGPTGRNNMIIRASTDAIVQHNRLINSSIYDKGHSLYNFDTDHIMMQYNEAYGNVGPVGAKDRGGFDADYNARNTTIQYNYSHDNNWGFGIMKKEINENVVIRYNISENDKLGIYYWGFPGSSGLRDAHIYNNTHYVSSNVNAHVFVPETNRFPINTEFINNIFYFEGSGEWGQTISDILKSSVFENNAFYNIPPIGSNSVIGDPKLVDPGSGGQDIDWDDYPNVLTGYKLKAGSPCINAGGVVPDNGGHDFWGNPLYISLPDIGAYESSDSTTIAGYGRIQLPESLKLHQNYPNPFNPSTRISYELSEWSYVRLSICNLAGQKIRSLESDELQSAGTHNIIWDGLNDSGQKASGGFFIYRLNAIGIHSNSTYSVTRKMLLLK